MEKKQTKKGGGGIWCLLLKTALPYVADNKKKFTNKSAISIQSSVITKGIKKKDYLEIDGIVPQIRKNRLAFKWYFYC